jgi:flagellar L-ring protein precursor FlgH
VNRIVAFAAGLVLTAGNAALADTLYVAPPVSVAPGHPLRLGADHRAQQVGDIVNVVFDFSSTNTQSDATTTTKNFTGGASQGQSGGIKLFNIINIPTTLSGNTSNGYTKTHSITVSFASQMMATVVDVLPSGTLAIAGDQMLLMNGTSQKIHITGIIRSEDIDNTDSILSNRVANVQARYDGNVAANNQGVIQKIMNFLF